MSKKLNYYLKFYDDRIRGKNEHYFHFLWGYLLPSIDFIRKQDNLSQRTFYFMSCGPIMDQKLEELLNVLNFNYCIDIEPSAKNCKVVWIERWDRRFKIQVSFGYSIEKLIKYIPIIIQLRRDKKDIIQTIDFVIKCLTPRLEKESLIEFKNKYIILERSEEPGFYKKESGTSKIKGYGKSRRMLLGIEEAIEELANKIPITKFEPGKYTLMDQIAVFQNAKGVIGIRGAEFANIAWMQFNTLVLMIDSDKTKKFPSPVRILAEHFKLDYRVIKSQHTITPFLKSKDIINAIKT